MRVGLTLLLLGLSLLLVSGRCSPAGPGILAISRVDHVAAWAKFEMVGFVWPEPENPFDPAQTEVRGEFRRKGALPTEIIAIPAFATRNFERKLVDGQEQLAARSRWYWTARFTPTEPGAWEWRWVATTPAGTATTQWTPFRVDPPEAAEHGFLRVSPLDPRYLRFDDGASYVAIGENLAWYDARGTFAYDDWLAKLAEQGVNYVRLWMPSWAFGLEWLERDGGGAITSRSLGDYSDRLDRARQLDLVIQSAARHGIYVMLSIQNHGPFSLIANSEWADNPYNAANGGPLDAAAGIFTDAAARELFRRRLRYLVARWGYSTHLLAWELWNEVNLVPGGGSPEALDWHAEMARELHALDPYDHLVTTSLTFVATAPVWNLPEMELVQLHAWQYPVEMDMALFFDPLLEQQRNLYPEKPTLVSEYGVDWRGPGETRARDPEAVGFHDGLWAGLLQGGFGTGMTWWWDNLIDPDDLYFHFGPIAALVEGIAFDEQGFAVEQPGVSAPGRSLAAYALRGASVLLAWIKDRDYQWFPVAGAGPDPLPVQGAALALTGLADGTWLACWLDAYTGEGLALEAVTIAGGGATLLVPPFARDVALRLERAGPGLLTRRRAFPPRALLPAFCRGAAARDSRTAQAGAGRATRSAAFQRLPTRVGLP